MSTTQAATCSTAGSRVLSIVIAADGTVVVWLIAHRILGVDLAAR